jgi:hypothetical protein
MDFTIYDSATGRIKSTGWTYDSFLPAEGESILQKSVPHVNGWIQGGDFYEMPPKTDSKFVFNWDTKVWEYPPISELQAMKWNDIKYARDTELGLPLVTTYGTFDADPKSQQALTTALYYVQSSSSPIQYTLADNSVITIDAIAAAEILRVLNERTQAIFSKAISLRATIDATTDIPTLLAITW